MDYCDFLNCAQPRPCRNHTVEIISPLGRGGYGAVYKGRFNGEEVAAKEFINFMDPYRYVDPYGNSSEKLRAEDLAAVRREIETLKAVSHPNITGFKCVQCDEKDVPQYLIMELGTAGSLRSRLPVTGTRLPHSQICQVGLGVACALEYLQSLNCVHRDIKPDNIVLMTDGTARVTDFGEAKFFNMTGPITGQRGTLAYQAPEMKQTTCRSKTVDVYALGVTIMEMLGIEPAFEHNARVKQRRSLCGDRFFQFVHNTVCKESRRWTAATARKELEKLSLLGDNCLNCNKTPPALADMVYFPCRHRVCCQGCDQGMTKCPMPGCRAAIVSRTFQEFFQDNSVCLAQCLETENVVSIWDEQGTPKPPHEVKLWNPGDPIKNMDLKEVMTSLGSNYAMFSDLVKDGVEYALDGPTGVATGARALLGNGLGNVCDVFNFGFSVPTSLTAALSTFTQMDWITSGAAHGLFLAIDIGRFIFGSLTGTELIRNGGEHVGGFLCSIGGAYAGTAIATTAAVSTAVTAALGPLALAVVGVGAAVVLGFLFEWAFRWAYRKAWTKFEVRRAKKEAEQKRIQAMAIFGISPSDKYSQAKAKYNQKVLEVHPDHNPQPDAAQKFMEAVVAWNLIRMGYPSNQIESKSEVAIDVNTMHIYCGKLKKWVLKKVWFTRKGEMPECDKPLPLGAQRNQAVTRTLQIYIA